MVVFNTVLQQNYNDDDDKTLNLLNKITGFLGKMDSKKIHTGLGFP